MHRLHFSFPSNQSEGVLLLYESDVFIDWFDDPTRFENNLRFGQLLMGRFCGPLATDGLFHGLFKLVWGGVREGYAFHLKRK